MYCFGGYINKIIEKIVFKNDRMSKNFITRFYEKIN